MQIAEILEAVTEAGKQYHAKEVILFGSRAKGTETPRSDIDIAVSGVMDFEAFQDAVENIPTLYSFDSVNLDSCENGLLLEEIREYGRKIL